MMGCSLSLQLASNVTWLTKLSTRACEGVFRLKADAQGQAF